MPASLQSSDYNDGSENESEELVAYRDALALITFDISFELPTGNIKRTTIAKKLNVLSDPDCRFCLQFDVELVESIGNETDANGDVEAGKATDLPTRKGVQAESTESLIRIAPTWRHIRDASQEEEDRPGTITIPSEAWEARTLNEVYNHYDAAAGYVLVQKTAEEQNGEYLLSTGGRDEDCVDKYSGITSIHTLTALKGFAVLIFDIIVFIVVFPVTLFFPWKWKEVWPYLFGAAHLSPYRQLKMYMDKLLAAEQLLQMYSSEFVNYYNHFIRTHQRFEYMADEEYAVSSP